MIKLTPGMIDGEMFLHHCSREQAIKRLRREPTEKELAEPIKLMGHMLKDATPEEIREKARMYVFSKRGWDASLARTFDSIRRCQIITAKDLAIRVGPC